MKNNYKKLFRLIVIFTALTAFLLTSVEVSLAAVTATAPTASQSTIYLKKGTKIKITPRYLAKGDKVKSYSSSKRKVATISKKGYVKGIKAGTTKITVKTKKGKKDTIKVKVVKKTKNAKSISLTKKKSMKVKTIKRLSVKTKPASATNKVKWSSSKKSVATVNAAGYITAKKPGVTTITVKTSNGKKAKCVLTVTDPVTLSKKSITVRVDRKAKISGVASSGAVKWSSSDKKIATVDKNGNITPKSIGKVNIIATSKYKTKATCVVNVVPHIPSTGVKLNVASKTVYATKTYALVATLENSKSTQKSNDDIYWSSSNTSVATVNASGVVTGKKYGTANITVKSESGFTATAKISVKNIKASRSDTPDLTPGIKISGFTKYGSPGTITYSSSDTSIATVNENGTIYAKKRKADGTVKTGTATITATSSTGEKTSTKVNLVDQPTIVDISHWQGTITWASAAPVIDFAILKATEDTNFQDKKYKSNASSLKSYGIKYGAYHFARYAGSKTRAKNEAKYFYKFAEANGDPTVFVIDAEVKDITRGATEEFVKTLRAEAKKAGKSKIKVGIYIGNHLYKTCNLNLTYDASNLGTPDFVWIPRYASPNSGSITGGTRPVYDCDLWQHTSGGGIPGITGRVDLNTLVDQNYKLLTKKSTFNLKWLQTP